MRTSINRLAEVMGYPDAVPDGALSYVFSVDGGDVLARESVGRIVLSRVLWRAADAVDAFDERLPVDLAGYAAGRILREEAVLAWDPQEEAIFLWQDAPISLSDERLRRLFEVFMTSCDWWLDRVKGASAGVPRFPEMMILP